MKTHAILLTLTLTMTVFVNQSLYAGSPPKTKKNNTSIADSKSKNETAQEWCGVMGTYTIKTDENGQKVYICVSGLAVICFYMPCDVSIPIRPCSTPVTSTMPSGIDTSKSFWARYTDDGQLEVHYTNFNLNCSAHGTGVELTEY